MADSVLVTLRRRKPRNRKASSTLDDVVRDRVQTWMAARGWSQSTFAKHLHRSRGWVSLYFQGGFNLDLTMCGRIAQAFGHRLDALTTSGPDDPDEALVIEAFRAMDPPARRVQLDFSRLWLPDDSAGPASRPRRVAE
jgi:transcriptional regulator with XRE-family HTH domain